MGVPDIKTLVKINTAGLQKVIDREKAKIGPVIKDALTEYAARVEASAKEFVPVKSGLLQSSIHTTFSKLGHYAKVRTDAKKAPHGHLVAFGTTHSEGTPFLQQAVEAHPKEELAAMIRARLDAEKEGS